MLTTVRQQMICVIAPDWSSGAVLPDSRLLEKFFGDVGIVHFASIALLPALDDAPGKKLPSLMLELAVEEGLRPYDVFYRLVNDPSGTMWSLYSAYWSNPSSLVSERNQALVDRLMEWHSIADGGFVGARDRSVGQIKMERDLLQQTRAEARRLKPQYGSDRASFALALSRWARGNPALEWAAKPAPRSWYCKSGAAKALYGLAIAGVVPAVLWLAGALSRLLMRADAWFFGMPHPGVQAVLDAVSQASRSLLWTCGRGVLALLALVVLAWLFFVVLPAIFKAWRTWLASLHRELDRPTETWSSLATYVVGWLVGVPLVIAVLACAAAYTFAPEWLASQIKPLIPHAPGWKLLGIGAVVFILGLGIVQLANRFNRLLSKLSARFYHPREDDVYRAQQVHPSIDQCEADLVGKTAHMISLTDMRDPNGWSVWWTRAALRIVTFAGRVFFTEGRLGDAPGIHFGHWHIIDNGRRYLFCSNYDGNFGGYLDDFINGATVGTTLAWRWTKLKRRASAVAGQPDVAEPRSFPPTRFAVFRGVKCELKFKSYARDSMLPHLYRFEACNTTVDEIDLATALRDALFGERNDKNDDLIMRAIEC
ncbi:MAG: hypothetical protein J0H42_03460 [Rhizobiales bacterium]|nr:hypothetical protein [Hyphomicrobiales bacterium]